MPIITWFKSSDYSFTEYLLNFHYEQVTVIRCSRGYTKMYKMPPLISIAIIGAWFIQQLIMYCLVISLRLARKCSLNPAMLFDFSLTIVFIHSFILQRVIECLWCDKHYCCSWDRYKDKEMIVSALKKRSDCNTERKNRTRW